MAISAAITMNKRYPHYKRTKPGMNRVAREAILEVIQSNLKANKNVRKIYGMDMTLLTSDEFIEQMLNQNNVLVNKVNLHIILKKMINEQLIIRTPSPITTGISSEQIWGRDKAAKKKPGRKRIVHGYTLNFNILNLDTDPKTLPNSTLYPTHQCNLCKVVTIFKESLNIKKHNPRCINRRLFTRLGYIMKHYFNWDFEKFRSWCQWIAKHAKKGLRKLLNSTHSWAIFIKQRFEKIYNKYAPMWLGAKFRPYDNSLERQNEVSKTIYKKNPITGTSEYYSEKFPNVRIIAHNRESLKKVPSQTLKSILNKYPGSVGRCVIEDEFEETTQTGKTNKVKIQVSYNVYDVEQEYRRRNGMTGDDVIYRNLCVDDKTKNDNLDDYFDKFDKMEQII